MLTKLPNELLFEIIEYVNSADINVLCQIPEMKAILDDYICVVTDYPDNKFKAISRVFAISEAFKASSFQGVEKVIVELHHGVFPLSFTHEPHIKNCNVSVFWDDGEMVDTTFPNFQIFPVSSIRLENITMLTLEEKVIPLHIVQFPLLTEMALMACVFTDHGKLKAPNLETLTVTGPFASINNGLDYERIPLRSLYVYDFLDMEIWQNIICPTLQLISMENTSLGVLKNLTFDNLVNLDIDGSMIREITDIQIPNALTMLIETSEELSIERLEAPELTNLDVYGQNIGHFHDWNALSLTHARFVLSPQNPRDDYDIDKGVLRRLESLAIVPVAHALLRHTPKLKVLEVTDLDFPLNQDYDLPLLKKIIIRDGNSEKISSLPRDILKNMQKIVFMHHNMLSAYDELKTKTSPKLEDVKIESSRESINLNQVSANGLKKLELDSPFEGTNVSGCHFPDLISFESSYTAFFFDKNSHFDLIAPLLQNIVIRHHTIHHLDFRGFTRLQKVVINGAVGNITFGNCSTIETLDLSKNNSLLHFSAGVFKSLVEFKCKETPFFQYFDLKAPLLMKRMENAGEVNYVLREN